MAAGDRLIGGTVSASCRWHEAADRLPRAGAPGDIANVIPAPRGPERSERDEAGIHVPRNNLLRSALSPHDRRASRGASPPTLEQVGRRMAPGLAPLARFAHKRRRDDVAAAALLRPPCTSAYRFGSSGKSPGGA